MMRLFRPLLIAALALGATPSLADLVVPEVEDCRDKKVGDPCPGGTCVSDGFSCQAGSCRRFSSEAECRADGCQWVEGITCRAATPPTPPPVVPAPTAAPSTTPTPTPVPGGCSAGGGALPVLPLVALLAVLGRVGPRARRRR